MNLRKTIFSYIILAVFVLFSGFSVFCVLEAAGFSGMFGWTLPVLIGAAVGYLLFSVAVCKALHVLSVEAGKHIKDRKRLESALAVALPVLTVLGMAVYLVFYLAGHIPVTLQDDTFYKMALVRAGDRAVYSGHGAVSLYVCLLHGALLIFGNTPFAGVVLQILLFFTCLLLLYSGMRAYAGAVPAALATAFFGFFSISLGCISLLTPEFFYLALYLFGFCLTGILYRKFCRSGISSFGQYVLVFLAGVYAGFLICLDSYGISLYFFFAVWYSVDRVKIKQAFSAGFTVLFGGICGFFICAAAFMFAGNPVFSWYPGKINPSGKDILSVLPSSSSALFVVFLLLIGMAFFIVPAFFIHKKSQNSAFILNLFLIYGLTCLGFTGLPGQMRGILCWCMLAGLGLHGTISLSEKLPVKKEKGKVKKKDGDHRVITGASDREEPEEKNADSRAIEKQEQEKPAPGKPLHNPLPVPKRKTRPQADFEYPVAEADMKFDIETADDDDFEV